MSENLKSEWIAALRSGEYPQAMKALYKPEGYCCLGVGCEVGVKAGRMARVDRFGGIGYQHLPLGLPRSSTLDPETMEMLGIDLATHDNCITANDNGAPFVVIAEYLETGDIEKLRGFITLPEPESVS